MRHGFSTRQRKDTFQPPCSFNLSHVSWDPLERVEANRRRLLYALDLQEAHLATLRQIHSSRVHIIKENPGNWNQLEGDALATKLGGIALAVQAADCFPILIADPKRQAVAAVHSGWRGTLAHIFERTVAEMRYEFGSDPGGLLVAVGPGIRACCFEVDSEVAESFDREYSGASLSRRGGSGPGKYLVDMPKALQIQFRDAGIRRQNVHDLGACTRCDAGEFFSYRAEGPRSGRMMAVIGRPKRGHDRNCLSIST